MLFPYEFVYDELMPGDRVEIGPINDYVVTVDWNPWMGLDVSTSKGLQWTPLSDEEITRVWRPKVPWFAEMKISATTTGDDDLQVWVPAKEVNRWASLEAPHREVNVRELVAGNLIAYPFQYAAHLQRKALQNAENPLPEYLADGVAWTDLSLLQRVELHLFEVHHFDD